MKPRLQFEIICDTEATADTVLAEIQTALVGKDIFSTDTPIEKFQDRMIGPQWRLCGKIRLNVSGDGDALYDALRAKWRGGPVALRNRFLANSRVSIHDCTHDDPVPTSCVLRLVDVK